MRKAVFLLPYFGPLLHWTELFLLTAGRNPDFRFVIYTDQPFDHFERYENIDWRPSKLEDMRARAVQATGLKIPQIKGGYKLCDFRPAFGEMFPDEIKEPFWGHIDLDMIWGRLDRFYPPKVFAKYDVISGDHKSLCGPFTLFRNSPKINRLYTEAPEFEETFLDPEHRTFDEHAMKRLVFGHPAVRLKTRGTPNAWPGRRGTYYYRDGMVFKHWVANDLRYGRMPFGDVEFPWFHMAQWKKVAYAFDPKKVRGWTLGETLTALD